MKLILKARTARHRFYLPSDAAHPYGQHVENRITGDVEVTIDEEGLAQWFATRALINKTGRAQAMGGMIKAKVINRAKPEEITL